MRIRVRSGETKFLLKSEQVENRDDEDEGSSNDDEDEVDEDEEAEERDVVLSFDVEETGLCDDDDDDDDDDESKGTTLFGGRVRGLPGPEQVAEDDGSEGRNFSSCTSSCCCNWCLCCCSSCCSSCCCCWTESRRRNTGSAKDADEAENSSILLQRGRRNADMRM